MNKIRVNSLIIHFKADPLARRFLTRTVSSSVSHIEYAHSTKAHTHTHKHTHRYPKRSWKNIPIEVIKERNERPIKIGNGERCAVGIEQQVKLPKIMNGEICVPSGC